MEGSSRWADHSDERIFSFSFADGEFLVGDLVPIEVSNALQDSFSYRFFSQDGEVLLQADELYYRPATGGPQTLDVYAIGFEGENIKQRLKIVIKDR